MAVGWELPDDLVAEVLRRLPPCSLAVSRSVCRAWRGLVDDRRLLRADLLPRSVGGIYLNYRSHHCPEFFSRPTAGPSISGDFDFFVPWSYEVVDHCNGLLLLRNYRDDYVANPATRRWARLPPCPMGSYGALKCLAYDPTMSPHYEVFWIPSLPDPTPPHQQSQWPPSSYALQVFSSMTGCWEERSFVLEGEPWDEDDESPSVWLGGQVVDKLYCQDTLYVVCDIGVVLRISLSDAKYRWVPKPSEPDCRYYGGLRLGRSEKGVYCAFRHDWFGLEIFLLNESGGRLGWELKHVVDPWSFARQLHACLDDYGGQHKGPWILQDINYYKHSSYGKSQQREVVENSFEWNSDDDDDVLNTEDMIEGQYNGYTGFLGFHPYKEIVFLNASLRRAVAYHWNTSKLQDLGNIFPKNYREVAGRLGNVVTSFMYTPCWMDNFPENNLEARK